MFTKQLMERFPTLTTRQFILTAPSNDVNYLKDIVLDAMLGNLMTFASVQAFSITNETNVMLI